MGTGIKTALIDMATGDKLRSWKITTRRERAALAFSTDSARLYTRLADHPTVHEWDVNTAAELRALKVSDRPGPPERRSKPKRTGADRRDRGCVRTRR